MVPSSLSDIIWANGKGHRRLKHITLPLRARSDTLSAAVADWQAHCLCTPCLRRSCKVYVHTLKSNIYKRWPWKPCVCLNAYLHVSLQQVISVRRSLCTRHLTLTVPTSCCHGINHDAAEVVAGSVSQRSSLLDFTLTRDLVTQQVVRVQIETNSAFLHSTHPESSIQERHCSYTVE